MKAHLILSVSLCLLFVAFTSYATFGPSVPVGIDTDRIVRGIYVSPDELTVYFYHNDGLPNADDIFKATRPDKNSPFGTPSLVAGLSSEDDERHPCLSIDGLTVYYMGGEYGDRDLYMATRDSTSDPFANHTVLTQLNAPGNDSGPSITADGLIIVYHSNRIGGLGEYDLYMATRLDTNSPFGGPVNIAELNSGGADIYPSISSDGRAIYFSTTKISGYSEIWMATRSDTVLPFCAPYRIDEIHEEGVLTRGACISRDGKTIYFGSDREGSLPGEFWMAKAIPRPAFATGGGWILPEDDEMNTHPCQKCSFRFNVRFKEGLPMGNIRFFCPQDHINLMSTSVEQLVVTGGKIAQFTGWARVNGQEGNWFFVEAIDNGKPGIASDRFEIKIWSPVDSPEGDPAFQAGGVLQGGNIAIHVQNNKK